MDKKKLRHFLNGYIFFSITVIGMFYIVLASNIMKIDLLVLLTFLINFILVIFNIVKKDYLGYSLDSVIWIFMLIFMIISPFLQYTKGEFPWPNNEMITDNILIKTNLVISIFLLSYITFKKLYKYQNIKIDKKDYCLTFKNISLILNLAYYLSIICSIYVTYKVGITNLFSRSTNNLNIDNSSVSIIVDTTFRAFPIIAFSLHYNYKVIFNKYYNKIQVLIISILGILVNFPTGLPRFQMAAIYLGITIILIRKFKNEYVLKYILLFGLLFIFPLIGLFRNNNLSEVINLNISIPNPAEEFLKGDFDSYSMLVRSLIYISSNGITWGRQLLGNVLFFIPRNLWPNKPEGTGVLIGKSLDWSFTNVSCPYIGEGLVNFGVIGILIFSMILAYIVVRFDYIYKQKLIKEDKQISVLRAIYPFIIGLFLFIMRGDLLSSVSFTIGFCMPCIILIFIDKIIQIMKKLRY